MRMGLRCTVLARMASASGSGAMPAALNARSKVGRSGGVSRRLTAVIDRPNRVAEIVIVCSSAPNASWLASPPRSYTQSCRVSWPCTVRFEAD